MVTQILGSAMRDLAVVVVTLAALVVIYVQEKKACFCYPKWLWDLEFDQAEMGHLPVFSYREPEQATNYFDKKRELGYGGYGKVHLGKFQDGRRVAVKRFPESNYNRVGQFMNELRILSSAGHCTSCVRIE